MTRRSIGTVIALFCLSASLARAAADVEPSARAQQLIDKGLSFLKTQQKPDGSWQNENDPPGITALVLRAFVNDAKYSASKDQFLRNGYNKLLSYQQASGGIYQDILANYNTAISVSALVPAAADPNNPVMKDALDRAVDYLRKTQWTEGAVGPKGETIEGKSNTWYGGFGYNRHSRPDLSNSHFSIEALHDAGLKPDDPAFQKALVFLTRCQNAKQNDQPWAGADGGFIYSPANGGDSEAESYTGPDGRKMWRSYGSMTYAGLKSMIWAGLTKDDPRVRAAIDWIKQNWTLDENPGMRGNDPAQAQHGLYYYFNVFAKSMRAYGEPVITDASGKQHDWRVELIEKVASLQRPDGSWAGEKRWMEDNPTLVTAYVVLALQEAQQDLKAHAVK